MNRLWSLLLPELRELAAADRPEALRAARETPLDFLELVGMALGMVVVTALTRYALAGDAAPTSRVLAAVVNFVLAIPLLAAFLGPFHVRRLRRGVRGRLRERTPR